MSQSIIFFTAGQVATPEEQTAIAALELQANPYTLKVFNAKASPDFGYGREETDFVAGAVPQSYSDVPVFGSSPEPLQWSFTAGTHTDNSNPSVPQIYIGYAATHGTLNSGSDKLITCTDGEAVTGGDSQFYFNLGFKAVDELNGTISQVSVIINGGTPVVIAGASFTKLASGDTGLPYDIWVASKAPSTDPLDPAVWPVMEVGDTVEIDVEMGVGV
jgi:hypothetical protein